MFYSGSLQEGISTAVGQQKLVFCFVTNRNEESQTWEDDFLKDDKISEVIAKQAIALRLEAGSEEAGYLAQIFPLPQTPTVVIIKNGELKEYITPGIVKDEFVRRIQAAFSAAPPGVPAQDAQPASVPAPATRQQQSQQQQPPQQRSQATGASASASAPPQAERSENVQRILAQRAAKLKAQKEEADRKTKEERVKAQEKAKAEAETGTDTDAARVYKQAELVKKKRQKDREERDRILKRIEDDKAERRQRAAERERQRLSNPKIGDVAAALVNAPETKLPSTTRLSDWTALQVRLFDGSTMRTRFKTNAPMTDVRKWVDESRPDGSLPYTFKQVLTPLPNKSIDATEESQELGDLGLAPSSTLVLVPVAAFTTAYDTPASGSVFSRFFRMILGFVAVILGLFGLGGDRRTENNEGTPRSPGQGAPESQDQSRVQGFQNLNHRRRDQQLYNGNSLNFEPRPDEEEK